MQININIQKEKKKKKKHLLIVLYTKISLKSLLRQKCEVLKLPSVSKVRMLTL